MLKSILLLMGLIILAPACQTSVVTHGWTKAAAEKEMLACGFHKELIGLWDYWEDYKP